MFPYRDENETQRPAYVTISIIALCVLVWIFIQGAGMGRALPETARVATDSVRTRGAVS